MTRYDIDGLTLGELPGTVLLSVLSATPAEVDGHEAATLAVRGPVVPDGEGALFDEVLGDARGVMDMRDDNGPLTVEWPAGLLRRALLSVGTRLVTTGRIADAEHALELTPAEARVIMRTGTPTAADLSERAAERARQARLTPPPVLGPEEPASSRSTCSRRTSRRWWPWCRPRRPRWGCSASGSPIP